MRRKTANRKIKKITTISLKKQPVKSLPVMKATTHTEPVINTRRPIIVGSHTHEELVTVAQFSFWLPKNLRYIAKQFRVGLKPGKIEPGSDNTPSGETTGKQMIEFMLQYLANITSDGKSWLRNVFEIDGYIYVVIDANALPYTIQDFATSLQNTINLLIDGNTLSLTEILGLFAKGAS